MSCPYCNREGAHSPSPAPGEGAQPAHPTAQSATAQPAHPTAQSATAQPASSAPSTPATAQPATAQPPRKRSLFRRGARRTSWMLPSIMLVLMPKCPICLAAYIALLTGISIPITIAACLRWFLIALCLAALVWLALHWSLYLYRRSVH